MQTFALDFYRTVTELSFPSETEGDPTWISDGIGGFGDRGAGAGGSTVGWALSRGLSLTNVRESKKGPENKSRGRKRQVGEAPAPSVESLKLRKLVAWDHGNNKILNLNGFWTESSRGRGRG